MKSIHYLLDTNVLSELSKAAPATAVEQRIQQYQDQCAVPTPVIDELAFGVAQLPMSSKKAMLEDWLDRVIYEFPLLSFDHYCTLWHGHERSRLRQAGLTRPYVDGQIAAIAVVNELILVTRNTADFRYFSGLRVEDWFT